MKLANKSSLTMQHLAHEISTLFLYRKQQPKCSTFLKPLLVQVYLPAPVFRQSPPNHLPAVSQS